MSLKRRMKRAAELGRSGPPPPRRAYGHEIVYTPMLEAWHDTLSPAARAAIPRLHATIQVRPADAVAELEELVERYPHVPVFYNFLNIAYGRVGQEEKRRALISRCRATLPDYLFGKIGEAEQLLGDGEYDAFADLWGGCYDLRELYPNRTQFHVSEFAGFYSIVGRYHHLSGNDAEARRICRMLRDVAPDEGATKLLDRELHAEALKVLIDALNPAKLARLLDPGALVLTSRGERQNRSSASSTHREMSKHNRWNHEPDVVRQGDEFLASSSAFPGVFGEGETREEAIDNFREGVEFIGELARAPDWPHSREPYVEEWETLDDGT